MYSRGHRILAAALKKLGSSFTNAAIAGCLGGGGGGGGGGIIGSDWAPLLVVLVATDSSSQGRRFGLSPVRNLTDSASTDRLFKAYILFFLFFRPFLVILPSFLL